jgi:hypothetical protein
MPQFDVQPTAMISDGRPMPSSAEYESQDYWKPSYNRQAAEAYLLPLAAGTFVIRPSSQLGALSLSHRKRDGSVGHALLHQNKGERGRVGWSIEDEDEDYESLHALLLSLDKLDYCRN